MKNLKRTSYPSFVIRLLENGSWTPKKPRFPGSLPTVGFLLLLLATNVCATDDVQLNVTMDNSIVMVDGEWSENAGQQGQIRIKGNQHIVAMAFDVAAIVGMRIKKATLVCVQGEQSISGVTISTIGTPWNESRSTGLTAGIDGINGWGYQGARFPAVIGGNSFTLVEPSASVIRIEKYHWDVPPDMVHAMAIGIAHGLAIHEHDADYGRNPTIFSREQSGKEPYLLIERDDEADPTPIPPSQLKVTTSDGDTAHLMLKAPVQGFAYEVLINGLPLGRHNIPLVKNGSVQTIPLRDLQAGVHSDEHHEIRVVTLNRTGQRSEPAVIQAVIFKSSPKKD